MSRISGLIKRYPIIAFFVLACALSWWPWILYTFDLCPPPLLVFPSSRRSSCWPLPKVRVE